MRATGLLGLLSLVLTATLAGCSNTPSQPSGTLSVRQVLALCDRRPHAARARARVWGYYDLSRGDGPVPIGYLLSSERDGRQYHSTGLVPWSSVEAFPALIKGRRAHQMPALRWVVATGTLSCTSRTDAAISYVHYSAG